MKLVRSLLVGVASASGAFAALACGSTERRPDYWPDADIGPSLPDASTQSVDGATDASANKPPLDPADEPVVCAVTPCAIELVAGDEHFCARMNDGTVRCWGDDAKGALGNGPRADSGAPDEGDPPSSVDAGWTVSRVTDLTGVRQLGAGGRTTCAVVTDGTAYCWGANDAGQLGLGESIPVFDEERHPTPKAIALPAAVTRVDVGPSSACAVLQTGELWCWGDNSNAQLARTTSTAVGVPGKAETGSLRIVATAIGTRTTLGVTNDGDVVSWGTLEPVRSPVAGRESSLLRDPRPLAIGLGSVTHLDVTPTLALTVGQETRSIAHACATAGGEIWCWGDSSMGALGMGLPALVLQPRRTEPENTTAWSQQVAVGGDFTCLRLTDGTIECAGDNAFGALGRDPSIPFAVFFARAQAFDQRAVKVAAAAHAVCVLVQDGSVLCWGSNRRGELGQGTTDFDPHPSAVRVRL